MAIDLWGWLLLIGVGVAVPWLAWRSKSALAAAGNGFPIHRPLFFWQTAVFHLLFLILAVVAAATNDLALQMGRGRPSGWLMAAALLIVAIFLLRREWRRKTAEERRSLLRILPQSRSELPPFVAVCVTASIGEELVYRGASSGLLEALGWPDPLSVAFLALAFGAGHALQGWGSAARIAVFAVGFHAIVRASGSLLPAIAVHLAYDLYAGLAIPGWEKAEQQKAEGRGQKAEMTHD